MITKTVVLPCPVEAAFRLFAERIDDWWPPQRRHIRGASVISLQEGRFCERGDDGEVVELGTVRAWEPPSRIFLDWYPGTGPEHPTEVEILFLPQGPSTRVEVRHGPGPHSGDLFPSRAPRYDVSWDIVLAALGRHASTPA